MPTVVKANKLIKHKGRTIIKLLSLKKKTKNKPLTILLDSVEYPDLSLTVHAAVSFLRANANILAEIKPNQSTKIMQPYGKDQVVLCEFENLAPPIDIYLSKLHLKTETIQGIWFLPEQAVALDYFSTDPIVRSRPWDTLLYHLSRSITAIIKRENLQERFEKDRVKYADFDHYEFIQPFANGHVIQAHISWTDGRQRIAFEFTDQVYVLPRIPKDLPQYAKREDCAK